MKSEQELRDELDRLQEEIDESTGIDRLQLKARRNELEWVLDDD